MIMHEDEKAQRNIKITKTTIHACGQCAGHSFQLKTYVRIPRFWQLTVHHPVSVRTLLELEQSSSPQINSSIILLSTQK